MKQKTEARTPLIVFGILLCLGPLWGLLGSTVGILETFDQITTFGMGNAEELATGISTSLVSVMIGFIAVPFGIVVLIFALVFPRKAKFQTPPPLSNIE